MTTLHLLRRKNGKYGPKKCQSSVKIKNKNKTSSIENLLLKCIETFLIHIYFNLKKF
jgi:hypothetical protein